MPNNGSCATGMFYGMMGEFKGHFFAEGFADESGWTKEHTRTMGPSWAHPVVAGGRLYLRHFNEVYCYGVEKE